MGGVQGSGRAYDMMGAPVRVSRLRGAATEPVDTVHLVGPRGIADPRLTAVLMGLGAIAAGLVTFAALWFLELMFSIWGSKPDNLPVVAGLTVALGGIAFAIAYGVIETRKGKPRIEVTAEAMKITLPEFRRPILVARTQVRLVSADDQPVKFFHNNKRFPIVGDLPPEVFADALDRGTHPWDPGEPQPRMPRDPAVAPWPPVPDQREPLPPPASPDGAPPSRERPDVLPWERAMQQPPQPHDHEPGWATVGSRAPAPQRGIRGYLYSGDGAALPVFTYNPTDLPNLVVLFNEPIRVRSGIAAKLPVRLRGSRMPFRGTRAGRIRGLMVKAQHADRAVASFGRWGVVREVTADDVLDAGLRPPKPLKGLRALAYAATLFAPLILKWILPDRW